MATSLMDTVADWCHLLYLFAFLTVARLLQWFILGFYTLFPFPGLLDRLYFASKRLQMWFSFKLGQGADGATPRSKARGTLKAESLVEGSPYALETHMAQTEDGFVLVLHRLVPRLVSAAGEAKNHGGNGGKRSSFGKGFGRSNSDNGAATATATTGASSSGSGARRPPVLLMHALMQDSEAFLCGGEHSLALFLADQGFDVWLGNNRGNRYSHKHLRLKPSDDEYWNFSIDELARYDVPALMDYVLQATGHTQLRYVGFSQGSAQAFAAFTMDQKLASKVKLFVALGAPPRAKGLSASYLSALVESNPRFIYLLFGRHAMLPSTLMWMKILSPQLFVAGVDRAIKFLFNWSAATISKPRKMELYQHIFSYASVKTVVQWFQLIKLRRLAMYSDDTSAHRVPVEYDLKRLSVPTAVFVGLKDTVIDPEALKRDLPPTSIVKWHEEPEYEHLDMIWADTAAKNIFVQVAALLRAYSGGSDK